MISEARVTHLRTFTGWCLAIALMGTAACADLNVTNPNNPDTDKVLRTPGDVEALIASSAYTWWHANMKRYPTMALSTMANQTAPRWADWGMQETAMEPRQPLVNVVGADFGALMSTPWFGNYSANKAANDGLQAIDDRGIQIGAGGADTPRARAFAKLVQGLSHGRIALLFDQGYIVDEETDIGEDLELVPYTEVMGQAIRSLEQAIQIAEANSFDIPAIGWIHGYPMSNQDLVRLAHSYIARYLASNARSPEERAQVDWQKVIYHADRGVLADFGPLELGNDWWAGHDWTPPGSHRGHLRLLGPADQTGAYQAWEAVAPADRRPFLIDTDDRRVTGGTPTANGKYFRYMTSSLVPQERGVWHQSNYFFYRFEGVRLGGDGMRQTTLTVRELRLLKAEGLYRSGDRAGAAQIVNETRVSIGELPPVTVDGTSGPRCVPRRRDGSCGNLFDALKWEKYMETMMTGSGGMFFDKRGWGDLYPGTAIHLPVPAGELAEMRMPFYTFGGGEAGSAPAW
jgi:hypothetical protein